MKKHNRVTILHGTNYWNLGDLALMLSLIQSLQRSLRSDTAITVLSQFGNRERPVGQEFDVADINVQELPWMVYSGGPRVVRLAVTIAEFFGYATLILARRLFGPIATSWLPAAIQQPVDALFESDLIVSKPGGFLYSYGRTASIQHQTLHLVLATLTGTEVVVYGQSIGPFQPGANTALVKWALSRANKVLARDVPSLDLCRDELGIENVELTADEAFLLEPIEQNPPPPGRSSAPLVGVTILEWAFPNTSSPAKARENYVATMAEFVRQMRADYDADVRIIPFVLGEGRTQGGDERITKELHARVGDPAVKMCRMTDPRHIKHMMKDLDAFVGSRMHSNILALGAGTPVMAIAYQPKTTGIMNMAGMSDYVLDINTISVESMKETFRRLWLERNSVREQLDGRIADVKTEAKRNSELTCELLQSCS